ncbi:MAG: hypothetical protein K1X64_13895 [Myxococcaceae bacterium]|nr:hypothetical protein [Myxococcaceae bacterium]
MPYIRSIVALLLISVTAAAQDGGKPASAEPPPNPEIIKQVLDYYYNGKARGPALLEFKACTKIDTAKDSPTKNECAEVATGPVKKNTAVQAWTLWYVPEGGNYEDISIQCLHQGQVRSTVDLTLNAAGRSRSWRSCTMSKTGQWTFKVTRGGTELGSTMVNVID